MVGDCNGVVMILSRLRRRPEEVRWIAKGRFEVRPVPCNGGQPDPDVDGLILEGERVAGRSEREG